MAEATAGAQRDARVMPSWSPSEPQDQPQEPPAAAPAAEAAAAEIEAARKLLAELFEDEPPAPQR
jgi:hypothetical protein